MIFCLNFGGDIMGYYIIGFVIMTLITSTILISTDWLKNPYDYGFGDYLFTGMVSIFWFIILPIYLIGYLGKSITTLLK